MKTTILVLLSMIIFVFMSCAPVNTKLMYNPNTGDVKECKRDPWKNWTWEEEAVLRRCSEEYKKLGYIENNDNSYSSNIDSDISKQSLDLKLEELKTAYDKGLITEQEYNQKRQAILDAF